MSEPVTSDDPAPDRRTFLARLAGGLGLAVAGPGALLGDDVRPAGTGRAREAAPPPVFDLHAHPGLFAAKGTPLYAGDEAAAGTVEAGLEGGLAGAFFSLIGDMKILEIVPGAGIRYTRSFEPGEAWEDYRRQMRVLRELLARTPAEAATGAGQVAVGADRDAVSAFAAVEGGYPLEGRAERLETMHADGVRSLQLVHYAPCELGDLQTEPARFGGLSDAGREVVAGMNDLGMVVDVAHASFEATVDAAEASDDPLLLSHSLLKTGTGAHLAARLVTPDHARVVAGTGGVIGLWPAGPPNGDLDGFVENTLRMIDVVGPSHVGLGTDMDGGPSPVLDDYGQLAAFADGLRDAGLSENEVRGVVGGNALRLLERVIGE